MCLSDAKKGETLIINSINADSELKRRFYSIGIQKGANVYIDEYSIAKSTIKIIIDSSMIALRFSEAQKIEVDRV